MKIKDIYFVAVLFLFFSPFFFFESVQDYYNISTSRHALFMSFVKFGLLATLGEVIGLRLSQGVYSRQGFGIIPRALFWGIMGVIIKISFTIFALGTPVVVDHYIFNLPESVLAGHLSATKVAVAFAVSVCMNLMFAPIFMVLHKISDIHIEETGGTFWGYFSKVDIARILAKIDWSVMWGFVFKKTLPLFWIPAHTITFLLPANYQVLFAALLGVVLGVILALAGMAKVSEKQQPPLSCLTS